MRKIGFLFLSAVLSLFLLAAAACSRPEPPAPAPETAESRAPETSAAAPEDGHPSHMTRPSTEAASAADPQKAAADSPGTGTSQGSGTPSVKETFPKAAKVPEEWAEYLSSRLPGEEGFSFDRNTLPSRTILYKDHDTTLTIRTAKKTKSTFLLELLAENSAKETRSVILRYPALSSWVLEFDRYLDIAAGSSEAVSFELPAAWFAARRLDSFRDFAINLEILEDYQNIDACRLTAFEPVPEEPEEENEDETLNEAAEEAEKEAGGKAAPETEEEPAEEAAEEAAPPEPEDSFSPGETRELYHQDGIRIISTGFNYTGENEYAILLENDSERTLQAEVSEVYLNGLPAEGTGVSVLLWPSSRNLAVLPLEAVIPEDGETAGGISGIAEIAYRITVKDLYSGEVLADF